MVDDARLTGSTEIISRTTASEMARIYATNTAALFKLLDEAGKLVIQLKATFPGGYCFNVEVKSRHGHTGWALDDTAGHASMLRAMKRDAWSSLIDKLNIRRLMSSSKQEALSNVLNDNGRYHRDGDITIDDFPDITEQSIFEVMQGYMASADDFLTESIREEWEHFKCGSDRGNGTLKTNAEKWKVSRKLITSGVRAGYGGRFDVSDWASRHFVALDQIMHLLDGAGPFTTHYGPLVTAIRETPSRTGGSGETEYFRFRLFRNGNIHLEFLRADLLDQFNCVGAGGSLDQARQLPNPVDRRQTFRPEKPKPRPHRTEPMSDETKSVVRAMAMYQGATNA